MPPALATNRASGYRCATSRREDPKPTIRRRCAPDSCYDRDSVATSIEIGRLLPVRFTGYFAEIPHTVEEPQSAPSGYRAVQDVPVNRRVTRRADRTDRLVHRQRVRCARRRIPAERHIRSRIVTANPDLDACVRTQRVPQRIQQRQKQQLPDRRGTAWSPAQTSPVWACWAVWALRSPTCPGARSGRRGTVPRPGQAPAPSSVMYRSYA